MSCILKGTQRHEHHEAKFDSDRKTTTVSSSSPQFLQMMRAFSSLGVSAEPTKIRILRRSLSPSLPLSLSGYRVSLPLLFLSLSLTHRRWSLAVVEQQPQSNPNHHRVADGHSSQKQQLTMVVSKPIGASGINLFCCWSQKGCHLILLLLCVLLPIVPSLPCAVDENLGSYAGDVQGPLGYEDECGSHGEGIDLIFDARRNSLGCAGVRHVCAHRDSFCFLSTLPGLSRAKDNCEAISFGASGGLGGIPDADSGWLSEGRTVYRLSDGRNVSCSFMGTDGGLNSRLSRNSEDVDRNDAGVCRGPLPPDAWMQKSSGVGDMNPAGIESSFIDSSSSPHVVVNPPLLDWGIIFLYSPSFAYLTVANRHNDSALRVFEPFSTDPQFYLHGFEEFSLAPGEVASIVFVFLPRWLGSSSAHLVLQTSFGGFIINAKGIAVESPFRIQPLAGFQVTKSGRLTKSLSLYNPFDEVLFVEEVALWVSVASGNISHSSHVVCHADAFQQSSDDLNASSEYSEWSTKIKNRYSRSLARMRPRGKWEVPPHHTEMILGMTLVPHVEGNVTGVLCMQLRNSSCDKIETVMVHLETEMQHRIGHQAVTNSVSLFLDPIVWCDDNGSTFMMSLRNDGAELLQVVKVSEVTESEKLFHISYMEGLMLYPGTLTHIALIAHASFYDSQNFPRDISGQNLDCKIQVLTNDTIYSHIDIPCQHASSRPDPRFEHAAFKDSYIGSRRLEESTNSGSESSRSIFKEDLPTKLVLELLKATELILGNWKSQSATMEMSVLEDTELIFSTVEVGSHCIKWIQVKNPSENPVVMQLLLNSGSVIDHCKTADEMSQHNILSRFDHINSMEIVDGFSLADSAIIEAFVNPFERATLGPIVFHPSDRCMWRSSALIRNNLSGVEWLPLQGVGGSNSLALLEGSIPVQKLDFNFDWSIPLNESYAEPKFRKESKSATCALLLSKELFVKNTGELPLEIVKLQVSGNSCELDGFRVHTCKRFALAPGQSMPLHVSYQPDFSAAVIHKDLEVALVSGIVVIPMRASIPVYMIKLCRRSFIWSFLRTLSVVVFAGFSFTILFFHLLPHISVLFSEDHLMNSKTITTVSKVGKPTRVHRNPRNARTSREDPKAEVVIIRNYTDNQPSSQDSSQNLLDKQDLDCQAKDPVMPPSSGTKSKGEEEQSRTFEAPQSPNLTIRIGREKGKRRKKRVSGVGAGLATKIEVSSSQSGNSTPSSPISPNAITPKQGWPLSSDSRENPYTRGLAEKNIEKSRAIGGSSERIAQADSMKRLDHTWQPSSHEQLPMPRRQTSKSILMSSATFPRSGRRVPTVAAPSFLASTSPIAPHARAPGSKLSEDTVAKRDEKSMDGREFTYDIWGNHLCDHIMGRSKEFLPTTFSEASEGDSLSLFARGPQSLVKMSSVRSVSPSPEAPSYDVNYNHQMV